MRKKLLMKVAALVGLLVVSTGCAGKLTKKKAADVVYFTDTSIALMGDMSFGLTRDDAIYNRDLFSPNEEEEQRLKDRLIEISNLQKALVDYSLSIVDIAEAPGSDADIVERYADYLTGVSDWVGRKLQFDGARYEEIIESVRTQETFSAALGEGQPVINAYGRYAELVIKELDEATEALVLKIDMKIDEKFADVVKHQAVIREERSEILRALEHLSSVYRGDFGAYSKLRTSRAIRSKSLVSEEELPTEDQLELIAQHLQKRLEWLRQIEAGTQRDWEEYRESHVELDRRHAELEVQRTRARLVFLVWIRAHKNMASGKLEPAEWFDVSSVPGILFKTGVSVAL